MINFRFEIWHIFYYFNCNLFWKGAHYVTEYWDSNPWRPCPQLGVQPLRYFCIRVKHPWGKYYISSKSPNLMRPSTRPIIQSTVCRRQTYTIIRAGPTRQLLQQSDTVLIPEKLTPVTLPMNFASKLHFDCKRQTHHFYFIVSQKT